MSTRALTSGVIYSIDRAVVHFQNGGHNNKSMGSGVTIAVFGYARRTYYDSQPSDIRRTCTAYL